MVVVPARNVSYNRTGLFCFYFIQFGLVYGEFLMPIYEYQCTGCHHQFDLLQKINDEPEKKCPQCSKMTAVRLVSAAGFQLKGSGWYATDFKNKGKPEQKLDNSTAASEAKGDAPKKTETSTTSSTTSQGESD